MIKNSVKTYGLNLHRRPIKLAVTIPAYNEEDSIGKIIPEIHRRIKGIDAIEDTIINDGSTDSTSETTDEAGADKIIQFPTNKGFTIAYKMELNAAIDDGALCGVKRFSTVCSLSIPKVPPGITRW